MTPGRCGRCQGPLGPADAFCGGCGTPVARSEPRARPAPPPVVLAPRRSRTPLVLGLVVLVAAAVGGYVVATRGGGTDEPAPIPATTLPSRAGVPAEPVRPPPTARTPVQPAPSAPAEPPPVVGPPTPAAPPRPPDPTPPLAREPQPPAQPPVEPVAPPPAEPRAPTPVDPTPPAPPPDMKPPPAPPTAPRHARLRDLTREEAEQERRRGAEGGNAWALGLTTPEALATVESVDAARGDVRFTTAGGHGVGSGPALVFVMRDRVPPHVFAGILDDDGDAHARRLMARPASLERVRAGDTLLFRFAPDEERLRFDALPAWSRLTAAPDLPRVSRQAARQLLRIDEALRAYAAEHGHLPPAIVRGPGGKPWHSWRTLILKHLGHEKAFAAYDFQQPWDAAANRVLLASVPSAYRDPASDAPAASVTRVAAALVPEGGMMVRSMEARTDGTFGGVGTGSWSLGSVREKIAYPEDTPLVGFVAAEHACPWTEPRDVAFQPTTGSVGDARFDFPWIAAEGKVGLFLFADGHLERVLGPAPASLRQVLAQAHKSRPDAAALARRRPVPAAHLLVFETVDGESVARFLPDEPPRDRPAPAHDAPPGSGGGPGHDDPMR